MFIGILLPALSQNVPTKLVVWIFCGQSTVYPFCSCKYKVTFSLLKSKTFDYGKHFTLSNLPNLITLLNIRPGHSSRPDCRLLECEKKTAEKISNQDI